MRQFGLLKVDVAINLPTVPAPKVKKSEQIIYDMLPEIKHMFREPEKRPPFIVSDTFVVLCIIPLFVLIIMVSFQYTFFYKRYFEHFWSKSHCHPVAVGFLFACMLYKQSLV